TDQEGKDESRHPQPEDDEVIAARSLADKCLQQVRNGQRVGADGETHGRKHHCQGDENQGDGARASTKSAPEQGDGCCGRAHNPASLTRRTRAIMRGAPSNAMTTPASSSAGRTMRRPITSATSSSTGPRTAE